jgi:hypothetical protein
MTDAYGMDVPLINRCTPQVDGALSKNKRGEHLGPVKLGRPSEWPGVKKLARGGLMGGGLLKAVL